MSSRSHLRLCVLDWVGALHTGEGRSQEPHFPVANRRVKATWAGRHLYPQHPDNTLTASPQTHRWRQSKLKRRTKRKGTFDLLFSAMFPFSPFRCFAFPRRLPAPFPAPPLRPASPGRGDTEDRHAQLRSAAHPSSESK